MTKKISVLLGFVCLLSVCGGLLLGKVLIDSTSQSEQVDSLAVTKLKKENKELKKAVESTTEPLKELPKQSYSNEEMKGLDARTTDFIKAYFTTKSNETDKAMEAARAFMTESGQRTILPFAKSSSEDMVMTISPYMSKNFVRFDSVLGTAEVMSFSIIQAQANQEKPTSAKYLLRVALVKEETEWLVDDLTIVTINQDLPSTYYP